jgi:hypothetical protein
MGRIIIGLYAVDALLIAGLGFHPPPGLRRWSCY